MQQVQIASLLVGEVEIDDQVVRQRLVVRAENQIDVRVIHEDLGLGRDHDQVVLGELPTQRGDNRGDPDDVAHRTPSLDDDVRTSLAHRRLEHGDEAFVLVDVRIACRNGGCLKRRRPQQRQPLRVNGDVTKILFDETQEALPGPAGQVVFVEVVAAPRLGRQAEQHLATIGAFFDEQFEKGVGVGRVLDGFQRDDVFELPAQRRGEVNVAKFEARVADHVAGGGLRGDGRQVDAGIACQLRMAGEDGGAVAGAAGALDDAARQQMIEQEGVAFQVIDRRRVIPHAGKNALDGHLPHR